MATVKWLRTALACAALTIGCLPTDATPPAEVLVNVRSSDVFTNTTSISTSDGWEVTFDRYLLTLQSVSLLPFDDSDCVEPTTANYSRIISLGWARSQKVALLFGRGSCGFIYEVTSLATMSNVVLGADVTAADRDAMYEATPALLAQTGDAIGLIPASETLAPGLYVEGSARKDGLEKSFVWAFWSVVAGAGCPNGQTARIGLNSGDSATIELFARGETLLESQSDGELAFGEFAAADDDDDGVVSQSELERPRGDAGSLYLNAGSRLRAELTGVASGASCR